MSNFYAIINPENEFYSYNTDSFYKEANRDCLFISKSIADRKLKYLDDRDDMYCARCKVVEMIFVPKCQLENWNNLKAELEMAIISLMLLSDDISKTMLKAYHNVQQVMKSIEEKELQNENN